MIPGEISSDGESNSLPEGNSSGATFCKWWRGGTGSFKRLGHSGGRRIVAALRTAVSGGVVVFILRRK
jgi:hypothetical protein